MQPLVGMKLLQFVKQYVRPLIEPESNAALSQYGSDDGEDEGGEPEVRGWVCMAQSQAAFIKSCVALQRSALAPALAQSGAVWARRMKTESGKTGQLQGKQYNLGALCD